jgi:hypothetical protein
MKGQQRKAYSLILPAKLVALVDKERANEKRSRNKQVEKILEERYSAPSHDAVVAAETARTGVEAASARA